jgi:hypothetical protein
MASGATNATIEGFVTDLAFTDQTKNVSDLFPGGTANVAELSSNALSYFGAPAAVVDKRPASERLVNWAAQTSSRIVVDEEVFSSFMGTMATLPVATISKLFAITDKLLFNYLPSESHATVETFLTTNAATKDIYVPGTFSVSSRIVSDSVYVDGAPVKSVSVPSYAAFDITVPSGATTKTYQLKLYAGIEAFLTSYSQSIIAEVIPPLPYDKLFGESLRTATDNIFTTASLTAQLSYNNIQARLKNTSVSGMFEFRAVLADTNNTLGVPFNILYKGRVPTLFEIRTAIKQRLLDSGVSDEAGWKKRIPGVFVSGRFYVVPLWDKTFSKPDQQIFPNVLRFDDVAKTADKILSTVGYADITEFMDVITAYYNRMSAAVVPDLSGVVDIKRLSEIIPDYQSYSVSDAEFAYMQDNTKAFVRELNQVLAIATEGSTSSVYGPNTEGLLSFYSFTAGTYEVCVITRSSYETILESEQ